MANEKTDIVDTIREQIKQTLKSLPWGSLLVNLLKRLDSLFSRDDGQGMYEVLEYESTLELLDTKGKKANFYKRQKVRYLQDNIIAYQDQAWGDGEILLNYKCSPGVAVDRYRFGHKTYILISLREVKNRGDEDEYTIERSIKDGFLRKHEQWETEVSHLTRRLLVRIIYPRKRPPLQLSVVEGDSQRSLEIGAKAKRSLPDGRWEVVWQKLNPRTYERYILQWDW